MLEIYTETANLDLAEFIRDMLQRWYYDRHRSAQSMSRQLTDAAQLKILKCIEKCIYMSISHVDWNIFLVKLKGDQWTVNLLQKICAWSETWITLSYVKTTTRGKHLWTACGITSKIKKGQRTSWSG
ncbi:hypothetical protein Dsin_017099 [Dipteronia sinensis]|uniref:Uncharacterized protein n=1 Tax=Dipteronia sinensis TaxID=43782 RepID=A0AAE0E7K2_9ROSI|nr:hypothetical protein Dsin_017099 [Dipteronia sinensis]